MVATYRVKGNDNDTIGFIIEGRYISYRKARENIDRLENLILQKNGVIRAKKMLPEINYKTAVINPIYKRLIKENPFQRDIQTDFMHWKTIEYKQIMQLGGARQVGKTTELLKFAYRNYEYVVYVNLADDVYDFVSLVESTDIWLDMQRYCEKANLPQYKDTRDTILIIDEIQNNKKVYNALRRIRSSLNCDIAITGSYLGITFNAEGFFLPAGTITYIDMTPLRFREFVKIYKMDSILDTIDLYGKGDKQQYNKLGELYEIYRKIGGYPEVIKRYLQTQSIEESMLVVGNLMRVYKEESRNYFKQPREVEIFEGVYSAALEEMSREKRGTGKSSLNEIREIAKQNTDLIVNKNEIANCIVWLKYTGILSTCDLIIDGDTRKISKDRRVYFSDCGILDYLSNIIHIDNRVLEGLLTETFAFNELKSLFRSNTSKRKVIGENICFSTYENNELDFIVVDRDKVKYGIEVKTKTDNPLSLKVFLEKGLIDRGIITKRTYEGHSDKMDTIPIYAIANRFPYKE